MVLVGAHLYDAQADDSVQSRASKNSYEPAPERFGLSKGFVSSKQVKSGAGIGPPFLITEPF